MQPHDTMRIIDFRGKYIIRIEYPYLTVFYKISVGITYNIIITVSALSGDSNNFIIAACSEGRYYELKLTTFTVSNLNCCLRVSAIFDCRQ